MWQQFVKFWDDVPAGTVFTVSISILTFSLGFIINEIIKRSSKRKEKRTYRKSLFFLLEGFASSCRKQSKVILKSLEKASFTNNQDFVINTTTLHSIEFLSKLDLQNLVSTLDKPRKHTSHNKAVSKLIIVISQINTSNVETKKLIEYLNDKFSEHENNYQNALGRLRNICDGFIVNYAGKTFPIEFAEFITAYIEIFKKWKDDGGGVAFNITYNRIVREIISACRNSRSQQSLECIQVAMEADAAYINIEKLESLMIDYSKDLAYIHKRAARLLYMIIKILKSNSCCSNPFQTTKKKNYDFI